MHHDQNGSGMAHDQAQTGPDKEKHTPMKHKEA